MPNLRSKTWTTITPAEVTDAQFWEDHLISDADAAKIGTAVQTINSSGPDISGNVDVNEVPSDGTLGQILTSDGDGGSEWTDAPVVDFAYNSTSYNAQSGYAVSDAVTFAVDDWYKSGTVASGSVTFSNINDTSLDGHAYKPFFELTSLSTELNPTAKITALSGAGTANMSITYQTTADEGTRVKLRRIK